MAKLIVTGCPAGWVLLDSNCYRLFESKLSWHDAEKNCQREGGHLASIHSKEENDFVSKLVSPVAREEAWIGGSDLTSEGSWVWNDGSSFSWTNWGRRQPDNAHRKEHCLTTNWGTLGQWNDLGCSRQSRVKKFVCKKIPGNQRHAIFQLSMNQGFVLNLKEVVRH